MYSVAQLKDSVSGILSGLNLSNVTNLDGALARSARILVQKADIIEASGRQPITLYDHVYDYAAPLTIFGGVVFDLRPQGMDRNSLDETYKQPIELFDQTKVSLPNGVSLTFEYNKGVGTMRVRSARTTSRVVLDPMTATSGWTAAGSASGLTVDATDYFDGGDSLRFLLTGASRGTLTKTINAGDMTVYKGVGVVFLAIKLPSANAATDLTSVAIKLGSSASAYTTVTATSGFLAAWTVGEWLLVALDLSLGSDTGTPDYTKITYLQVSLTHGATMTNFRVGGIWASLPTPYELLFGSAAIFMAAGQNPSQAITDNNDSILLNDAAYTIYELECAKTIAKQMGGTLASGLVQSIDADLLVLYNKYSMDNPSNEIRTIGTYA
jgi:hypothetical protein